MAKNRVYLHRYRVLSGHLNGQVFDGEQIGIMDYPDQWRIENLDLPEMQKRQIDAQARGRSYYGIYLHDLPLAIYPTNDVRPEMGETVVYAGFYEDMLTPFDRNNQEIFVGDYVYAASKNEVRYGVVTKIGKLVYMDASGCYSRKITVRDETEDQTLVIGNSRSLIKADPIKI